MNIKKENGELVLRIPLKQKSYDAGGEEIGEVDNLIGVVVKKENYYAIAQLCDLGYKDDQQEGSPYVVFDTEEDLRDACDELKLHVFERESYVKITKGDIVDLIVYEIALAHKAGESTSRLTSLFNKIK